MAIFVAEGMSLSLNDLALAIDESGGVSGGQMSIDLAYDTCVAWARIALERRSAAIKAMSTRRQAWENAALPAAKALAIEYEFDASMQCIVASAASVDALYNHLRRLGSVDSRTAKSWGKNRAARHSQIAQTITRTFPTSNVVSKGLGERLAALFKLRDAALHPSHVLGPAYQHPEIGSATAWQFTTFRGDVADFFSCMAVGLLWDLANLPKYRSTEVESFALGLRGKLNRLLPEGRPTSMNSPVTSTRPPRRSK